MKTQHANNNNQKNKKIFAQKFESLLEARQLTIAKIARRCKIHDTSLYNYLQAKTCPNYHTLQKLAKGLKIDIAYFSLKTKD